MYYIDTSAAVKLLFDESESPAMHRWAQQGSVSLASSDLLTTELLRTVNRVDPNRARDAATMLADLHVIEIDSATFARAGDLAPKDMRSLDAVHLAAALEFGDELDGIVTYDQRLADAAEMHGIAVIAPS